MGQQISELPGSDVVSAIETSHPGSLENATLAIDDAAGTELSVRHGDTPFLAGLILNEHPETAQVPAALVSRIPSYDEIFEATKHLIALAAPRVFNDLGMAVRDGCLNHPLNFKEGWVGIENVGFARGVEVSILLCHDTPNIYNQEQNSFRANFLNELERTFTDIQSINISIVRYPLVPIPPRDQVPMYQYPDHWKCVFGPSSSATL